jgi:hypothetical protein
MYLNSPALHLSHSSNLHLPHSVCLAVVLLTLPTSQNVVRLMPYHHGTANLKECSVPFTAHSMVLPTLVKQRKLFSVYDTFR